jgi:peptidoglycan/xylan/chitin deacetylase (PgdA/CDA1 family)
MPHHRLDRFAALHFVRPARRIFSRPNKFRIPILMYHSISDETCNSARPSVHLETSTRVFEAHIRYLHENGYRTLSTAEVVGLLNCDQTEDRKCVALTFDDGYRDFYTNAFPLLNRYGFRATVYLPTAYINSRERHLLERDCLTWTDVRELHQSGVDFGSHTISHMNLEGMADADLEREIRGSKETIEDKLGTPVHSFAYPYVFPEKNWSFTHRLRDLLKVTGYHDGVSRVVGTVQSFEDRFFLRRVPANSGDDITLFKAKLEGDYDWFHKAQSVSALIKRVRTAGTSRRTSPREPVEMSLDYGDNSKSDCQQAIQVSASAADAEN